MSKSTQYAQHFPERALPAVSAAAAAVLVMDSATNVMMVSENGGAFEALGSSVVAANLATLASMSANDANLPATAPATAIVLNEHPLIAFDDTVDERCEFTESYPSWTTGAASFAVDILWAAATAAVGAVKWDARLETTDEGIGTLPIDAFGTLKTTTTTTAAIAGNVVSTTIAFTIAEAQTPAAGASVRLRIIRDATDGADTMIGDAQLLSVVIRKV